MSRRLRLLGMPIIPLTFALSTKVCDLSLCRRADAGLISIGADLDVFVIGASLRPSMRTTATKANDLLLLVLADGTLGLAGMDTGCSGTRSNKRLLCIDGTKRRYGDITAVVFRHLRRGKHATKGC